MSSVETFACVTHTTRPMEAVHLVCCQEMKTRERNFFNFRTLSTSIIASGWQYWALKHGHFSSPCYLIIFIHTNTRKPFLPHLPLCAPVPSCCLSSFSPPSTSCQCDKISFFLFLTFLLRSLIIWGPELSCLLLVSSFSLFSKKNLVFQFKSSVWGAGLVPVLYSIYVLSNPSQQRARSPAPITLQFNNILFFLYVLSTSPKNFQLFLCKTIQFFFVH